LPLLQKKNSIQNFKMKKTITYLTLGLLFLTLTSFELHKFYMAIYQINYASEKKMIQITSRIFVDDLDKALEKKYHKKVALSVQKIDTEDLILLKKYLSENFSIKVNGKPKPIQFLSSELDSDVLICYSNVKEISKINTLEIYNNVLTDWNSDQQNITHITTNGTKRSILFTESLKNEVLKYE
jgi:hypothetical protein